MAPWSGNVDETPEGVQARVVEALALDAASDPDGAAAALERALDLAEPSGLRWALMQFGRPLSAFHSLAAPSPRLLDSRCLPSGENATELTSSPIASKCA